MNLLIQPHLLTDRAGKSKNLIGSIKSTQVSPAALKRDREKAAAVVSHIKASLNKKVQGKVN